MAIETEWTVRPVAPDDESAWRRLYRGYRSFYEMPSDEAAVDVVWGWLNDREHESNGFVAVDGSGRLAGLANVRPFARPLEAGTGLYLDDLFTDPDVRGRGAGRAILRFLKSYAAEHGIGVVCWITAEDNSVARSLYDAEALATRWVTYEMEPRDSA
jgi:GNAT superfamily N-acetyltransferase